MRFSCSQEHLLRSVQTVGRAISPRASMPILGNILIEASKDGVKLAATDLELGIEAHVSAKVQEDGAVTLPARILTDIVTKLPEAPVEITVEEGDAKAVISCESVKFELVGLPSTDFPIMPSGDGNVLVKIDGGLLRTMIRQTSFAVSTDETRPFLTGVYVQIEGGAGQLVATDGGRLALRRAKISGSMTPFSR